MNTHEPPPLTVWAQGGYELAEGSRWLGDRLIFADILSGRLLETSALMPTTAKVIAHVDVPLEPPACLLRVQRTGPARAAGRPTSAHSRDARILWRIRWDSLFAWT
jgi:hypothetical protein